MINYSDLEQQLTNPRRHFFDPADWTAGCVKGQISDEEIAPYFREGRFDHEQYINDLWIKLADPWKLAETFILAIKLLLYWGEDYELYINPVYKNILNQMDIGAKDHDPEFFQGRITWPAVWLGERQRDGRYPSNWISRMVDDRLMIRTSRGRGYRWRPEGPETVPDFYGWYPFPWGEASTQAIMALDAIMGSIESGDINVTLNPLQPSRIDETGMTVYTFVGTEWIGNCAYGFGLIYARRAAEALGLPLGRYGDPEHSILEEWLGRGFNKFIIRWAELVHCRYPFVLE